MNTNTQTRIGLGTDFETASTQIRDALVARGIGRRAGGHPSLRSGPLPCCARGRDERGQSIRRS